MASPESSIEVNFASEEGLMRRNINRDTGLSLRRDFFKELPTDANLESSKISIVISNVLWLAFAYGVFYYTDFYVAVLYDPMVQREWMLAAVSLFGASLAMTMFCVVYLSWWLGASPDKWEALAPPAIPIATTCFLVGSFCLNVAVWPLWSWLTPPLLFVLFMGLVSLVALIPPWLHVPNPLRAHAASPSSSASASATTRSRSRTPRADQSSSLELVPLVPRAHTHHERE